MEIAEVFAQYLEHVFAGKRCEARELLAGTLDRGVSARKLIEYVIWPSMAEIEKLYRRGRVSRLMVQMAMRINRMMADQLQAHFARRPKTGLRMVVTSGDGEIEELGAQMTADLFEAEGWSVWFLGSGIPNDEVLELLSKIRPDILCIYGAQPAGLPALRMLMDMIRDVGAWDQMQTLLVGGVFNRAIGLGEEIRADLHATGAKEALKLVAEHPVRIPKPDVPQPGRRRKRKPAVPRTKAKAKAKPKTGAKKRTRRAVAAAS